MSAISRTHCKHLFSLFFMLFCNNLILKSSRELWFSSTLFMVFPFATSDSLFLGLTSRIVDLRSPNFSFKWIKALQNLMSSSQERQKLQKQFFASSCIVIQSFKH